MLGVSDDADREFEDDDDGRLTFARLSQHRHHHRIRKRAMVRQFYVLG